VDRLRRIKRIEQFGDGVAGVPRHRRFAGLRRDAERNVHSIACADRNEGPRFNANLRKERFVLRDDFVENLLRVIDEIHLVHGDHDLLDPEQRKQITVPPRLLAHTFIRRDEQHRCIRTRRARNHVLQELLVTGRVDDDIRPLRRLELNLRRIDGDVLFLFLEQCIEQKRVLKFHPLLLTCRLNLLDLPFRQRVCVVEDPANERGLAVIDVADEDDAKTLSVYDLPGHHMNPLARSFCIAFRS